MEELVSQLIVYLRGMWRFRWWGLALAWIIGIVGTAVVATMPDKYESTICDCNCAECNLELDVNESDEMNAIGIEQLLSDYDDTISLIPSNNERYERRNDSTE